jgi:hypothetical protein
VVDRGDGDGDRGRTKEAKAQSVRGTDEVLYREVVKRVHSVFTEENLERMPTRRIPKAESTLPNARQLATLQPDLEAEYEDLLQVRHETGLGWGRSRRRDNKAICY